MKYLLDTNVCIDYLNGRHASVTERIHASRPADLCVSSVVAAELRYGAQRSAHPRRNHSILDVFLREMSVVDFDHEAARIYGRIRTSLERRRENIGPYDLLIAGHALSLRLVLVTDNVREFLRVAKLKVENWRTPGS